MAKSMKLGGGGRFQKLERSIAAKGKVSNPGAVAATIGRKKYGKKKFQAMAAEGRRDTRHDHAMPGRLRG